MIALALAAPLASPAQAQPSRHERALRDGTWNQRIHAATALGAL